MQEVSALDDPEQLLCCCEILRSRLETSPAVVRDDAEYFFDHLEHPRREIGRFDERDYFLGEFALIAGTACRVLALRERAHRWFDRAEACFVLAQYASAHVARVAYQRLALRLDERDFDGIADLAPRWVEAFSRLDLPDDSLKCRFLEAHALKETGRLEESKASFRAIRDHGKAIGALQLAGIASENLFQIHAFLGESEEARAEAEFAIPLLLQFDNRVGRAKLQTGLGHLLRSERNLQGSIAAFREAQKQFAELDMHADVAATHLVLADLLLDANQPAQAEWEIRAALPVIDELKLVPEGIAALSLLRDSVRRRQIDRQALRSLNGYFEELKS
jgi:tetratricopeptide (TPR) repeat protein